MNKNEIILFETKDHEITIPVETDRNTVWLTRQQMADLFDRDVKTIGKHINNALKEELDDSVVAKFATTASDGKKYETEHYNLDMIISIGYRVKSNRGVEFRKWASSILKQYMIEGYAANQKRLDYLNKTVELQSRIISSALEIAANEVLKAVNHYTHALEILDDYDHHALKKPDGRPDVAFLTYEDVRNIIDNLGFDSAVFGVEKEPGRVKGILAAVYQNVFGKEVYPSLEEKAANLLYFIIKDHPFADGCKRIGASLFLEFLARNGVLYKNGHKRISDAALVAITLMIAESDPKEKEIMTTLVMNFLL